LKFLPYNEKSTKHFFKTKEDDRIREEAKSKSKGAKVVAPKKEESK